jgi:hypothetical protein
VALFRNCVRGGSLYVWSKNNGSASSTECVISAHGLQRFINYKFTVEHVTLVFYAPPGRSLNVRLEDVITGSVEGQTPISSGRCQDYELSKYQGNHGAGLLESYNSIGTLDEYLNDEAGKWEEKKVQNSAGDFDKYIERYSNNWKDVVTIRNRQLKFNPMLSEVLRDLYDATYRYNTVHCSFCRCTSDDTREDYSPKNI